MLDSFSSAVSFNPFLTAILE